VDTRVLVVENDPTDDIRRLGDWLTASGLELDVRRCHAGDALPPDLTGYAAFVVLGGEQAAYGAADGEPDAPWFPELESLLRKAVRHAVPTLAICLGGQLLATANGGRVERGTAGPEIGPGLVGRRDAAENDPLFAHVPLMPDVLQWHSDEIVALPNKAVLLAAGSRYANQAFRVGTAAWGTQFHIECDTAMVAGWVEGSRDLLAELGYDPQVLVDRVDATMDDLAEAWQPMVTRFAALAKGQLSTESRRELPLLGSPGGQPSGPGGC